MADKEGLRQIAEAYCKSTVPAFCKTPAVPVGYDLIGFYNLAESTADTVRMTSCETFTAESRLFTCQGNEAGVGGGVVSGVNLGYCKPLDKWSQTVRAKNQWICRHDTLMGMNCAGPEGIHETEGIAYYVKSTTCVKVEPSGQIAEEQTNSSDEKDADSNDSESSSDAAPSEAVQDADIRRAGESLKEQAVAVKDAVVGVAEDVKQSVQNIIDDPSIVGKNLDRLGNSISEYGEAASQDWTKPFRDAYSAGENLVSGAWGEIKEVASETATETANNQPLTALAKAVPKLIGAIGGAKGVISAAKGLKSTGGKILGKKKPKVPAGGGGASGPGKDGIRIDRKAVAAANTGNWRSQSRTGKKKTVLGKTSDGYEARADKLTANKFKIEADQWDKMSDAERWAANKEFLDDCIASNSEFELVTHFDDTSGYYFQQEKDYLLSQGYKPTSDGYGMINSL